MSKQPFVVAEYEPIGSDVKVALYQIVPLKIALRDGLTLEASPLVSARLVMLEPKQVRGPAMLDVVSA